jgi:hypothetical protein
MTDIVKYEQGLISNIDDAARAAKAMALSGYFSDAREIPQAMVKIMAGHEMGFGPFASMNGIHVIKGKLGVGANLMAAAVKSNPRYDYRVRKMDDTTVVIEFFQDGESIGESSFTIADAKKAGTQNLDKFPRNMLFARAMSNGVRWFCPDVFAGNAVYTPDELGATVDGDGEIVDGTAYEVSSEEPQKPTPADVVTEAKRFTSSAKPSSTPQRGSDTSKEYDDATWPKFQRSVLKSFPYFKHDAHVVNTLKGAGMEAPWTNWNEAIAKDCWNYLAAYAAENAEVETDQSDDTAPFEQAGE